ncbi:ATP-binding cassette domain-containing protein [Rickettsiales bacterium]|nr:ATP-binding cassette domain-containing protein [Rickettsiales bacterium]
MSDKKPLSLRFENIKVSFNASDLFKSLSFKINSKGISLFMGPNGAGKTVCLKLIADLLKPDSGRIFYNKKIRIGYVAQKTVLLRRSVYDNLLYALKISNFQKDKIKEMINNALIISNLNEYKYFSARTLSIGQQQLLAIMRALIIKPNLLLLDEPCSNLDPQSTKIIEKILGKVSSIGVKVILVTHDVLQAKRIANEILFIYHGKIIEQTSKKNFFSSPKTIIANNYLKGMLLK